MQAGVVMLDETGLHCVKCLGCTKANWNKNICQVITNPREEWRRRGRCRYRSQDPDWRKKADAACTQYQQARWPGPWDEDPLLWLASSHPPSIRDKEAILHLPAPPAKSGGSKSKRKRKMPKANDFYNPYL